MSACDLYQIIRKLLEIDYMICVGTRDGLDRSQTAIQCRERPLVVPLVTVNNQRGHPIAVLLVGDAVSDEWWRGPCFSSFVFGRGQTAINNRDDRLTRNVWCRRSGFNALTRSRKAEWLYRVYPV